MASFSTVLIVALVLVFQQCNAATVVAAEFAQIQAISKMETCSKTSRAVFKDCMNLLAKDDAEMATCAKEFSHSFPACFSTKSPDPEAASACNVRCWRSHGRCTGFSLTAAERFTCWNAKSACTRACNSAGAPVDQVFARMVEKRTVESCLSNCEGLVDVCRMQALDEMTWTLCIFAKQECRKECRY